MRYLLDTHALIWFLENDLKLSSTARNLIEHPTSEILVSTASLWEIAIKTAIGKMSNSKPIQATVNELTTLNFELLPIDYHHVSSYLAIPLMADHRDPFDRLLLATALSEGLNLITADEKFIHYKHLVNIIW